MSVHSLRNAACVAAFAVVALLAACQGNIGTGSGLPAAPGQGVAPGQGAGGSGSQSRQRVVEGAVYLTPDMGQIPLPTLGDFSVTLDLGSPPPFVSSASPAAASPTAASPTATSPAMASPSPVVTRDTLRTKTSERVIAQAAGAPSATPASAVSPTAQPPSAAATPSVAPTSAASPAPSGAAGAAPSGAPHKGNRAKPSEAAPSPQPSGPKIETKLTVYPEDAPSAPTPAPTGNVQNYLKRVALVRGFVLSHTNLTLYGLGAVRFTIPSEEQTPNRGFTVAVYDQSKKHHDRLVAWDAKATLSGSVISATASSSPIPLKKDVGYAFLLYGDELAPAAAPSGYPAPGNNPFATPPPAGAAPNPYATQPANPYATATPYNPYATPTPYNPYATPTPYNPYATPTPLTPYVPTIPPPH